MAINLKIPNNINEGSLVIVATHTGAKLNEIIVCLVPPALNSMIL